MTASLNGLHDPYGELADMVAGMDTTAAETWTRALARARQELPEAHERVTRMRRHRREVSS